MNRSASLSFVLALTGCMALACSKDKGHDAASDLPVANSWNGEAQAQDPGPGMNMGAADPHAGVDMGDGADPHAGLDMTQNGNPGGLEAPDPNRVVDTNMFLKGKLSANEATASLIRPGGVVFISVRPINKATGESLGAPLAVDRLDVSSLPMDFHLSAAQMMVAGTRFEGDVVVYARLDGDGEASSTLPGDVEGRLEATIPADGLSLVFDTVVQ